MTALALRDEQTDWDENQIAVLRSTGIDEDVTRPELQAFLHECQRRKLDPFTRQIYLLGRWDARKRRKVYRSQTSIDGFRLIARRAADEARESIEYEDTLWCGPDGKWLDVWLAADAPSACKVTVLRNGKRFPATARFSGYVQVDKDGEPMGLWRKMPDSQLSKCFSSDTEILTDQGFRRFADVGDALIMQVTPSGLDAVNAVPFVQEYGGPMVVAGGDMLNFSVTPNHDMVTTFGKAEAGAIFATATTNYGPKTWRVPLTAPGRQAESRWSDDDLRLAGFIAADGWHNGYRLYNVAVSRAYKVAELAKLAPETTRIQHCAGAVAPSAVREVRSNFDKTVFTFPVERVTPLMGTDKRFAVCELLKLSQRQARVLLDAWQLFDGSTNRKTGVRRIYTSRDDHLASIEILAMLAGYSVNVPRKRTSDIAEGPGFCLTLSEPAPQPLVRAGASRGERGMRLRENADGSVWCVTVPSGQIIVRRNGFAMVCGNCAEALALRKAFPEELGSLYTDDEMAQADGPQTVSAAAEAASDAHPAAVADLGWYDSVLERAATVTEDDYKTLWAELGSGQKAGKCTTGQRKEAEALIAARMDDLRSEQSSADAGVVEGVIVTGLAPEDSWYAKVESVISSEDAAAAIADVQHSKSLTVARKDQIIAAIKAREASLLTRTAA